MKINKICYLLVITLFLTACIGELDDSDDSDADSYSYDDGNGNGNGNYDIDLWSYLIPRSNTVNSYDVYRSVNKGNTQLTSTYDDTWQVSANTAHQNTGSNNISSYETNENYITINSNFNDINTLPRYINQKKNYDPSSNYRFVAFGPFPERRFDIKNGIYKIANDVIIMTEQIQNGEDISITVSYYAKSTGLIGVHAYTNCISSPIELSPDQNYTYWCNSNSYTSKVLTSGSVKIPDETIPSTSVARLSVISLTTAVPSNPPQKTCTNRIDRESVALNTPVQQGGTTINSLTFKTYMDTYFGDAIRRGTLKWEGVGSFSQIFWAAEVMDESGTRQYVTASGKRVFTSYLLGTWKGPGQGFGSDMSGSPWWHEVFKVYNPATNKFENGVSEAEAKNIYRTCHTLGNFRILGISGKDVAKLNL